MSVEGLFHYQEKTPSITQYDYITRSFQAFLAFFARQCLIYFYNLKPFYVVTDK